VRPLTSRNLPADLTATSSASLIAARANTNPQFNATPQQVTLSPDGSLPRNANVTTTAAGAAMPPSPIARPAVRSTEARAFRVWFGLGLATLLIAFIGGVAMAAFWFSWRGSPASKSEPVVINGEAGPASNDPKQLANVKLAEADSLLASGNTEEAAVRLREAAALDPANAEPQRRLARLLLAGGARRDGIEALKAVTRLAPDDTEAWLSLASAQSAEGLYEDAVESYRGLGEASPAALARDTVQLAYADALRLSGRNAEARVIYRRLASSPDAKVADASKLQLGQPKPSPTNEAVDKAKAQALETAEAAGETNRTSEASSAPPAPQPSVTAHPESTAATTTAPRKVSPASPSEHYERGVSLWATNRGAAVAEFRAAAASGNADASYYLGLSVAEGRDPRLLKRAELVAALVHFGQALKGRFRAQSLTYEEQLGRELDRRRNDQR
jgi:tetratricopeptide (TPR) repeat protein